MKVLSVLFFACSVAFALKADVVYTYENNGQTFVATASGSAAQFSDEGYAVLNEIKYLILLSAATLPWFSPKHAHIAGM